MNNINLSTDALKLLTSDSFDSFMAQLEQYALAHGARYFTIWDVTGALCKARYCHFLDFTGMLDLFDLGYHGETINEEPSVLFYFDDQIQINASIFLHRFNSVHAVVTFHGSVPESIMREITYIGDMLSMRLTELLARDRQLDVYVDYQKKIDFMKNGSTIFTALALEDVVAVALNHFMEVFSAEAAFCLLDNQFTGVALSEDDIHNHFTYNGQPFFPYLKQLKVTEFLEEQISSDRFAVTNAFLICEESANLRICLFNIRYDLVPDKELSEMVANIVSIAVENAKYHQKMTDFKVEEAEMTQTVDILNRFVSREYVSFGSPEIFGITIPAKRAGGDYILVRETDDSIFFCIADVCGKGYSAAVFTVALSVMGETASGADAESLDDFVHKVNDYLLSRNFDYRFITAFFAVYDKKSRVLSYVSCGHEPSILIVNGVGKELSSTSLPLGIDRETYTLYHEVIPEGALLMAYTDGVIEYIDYAKLFETVIGKVGKSPREIVTGLYYDLVTDQEKQRDDFTCIVLSF